MTFSKAKTPEQIKKYDQHRKITFWNSRFLFLKETNGFRPATMNVIMAPPSAGKSTLLASLAYDTHKDGKVLIYSTEETSLQLQEKISREGEYNHEELLIYEDRKTPESIKSLTDYADHIKLIISQSQANIIFFDNITTQYIYSNTSLNEQPAFVNTIARYCENEKKTIVFIAHAGKKAPRNALLTGDDIMGTNQLYMQAHFFYILQTFSIGKIKYAFMQVTKHRLVKEIKNNFFLLKFSDGRYVGDKEIDFSSLKEQYRKRNVL